MRTNGQRCRLVALGPRSTLAGMITATRATKGCGQGPRPLMAQNNHRAPAPLRVAEEAPSGGGGDRRTWPRWFCISNSSIEHQSLFLPSSRPAPVPASSQASAPPLLPPPRLCGPPLLLHPPMPQPYSRMDPYRKARYDQGVDAKIVIMGNTGPSIPRFISGNAVPFLCAA